METYFAKNFEQLLDVIGTGNQDPHDEGPEVIEIHLEGEFNEKIIKATYKTKSDEKGYMLGDVESRYDTFINSGPLLPFVLKLLCDGTPFITVTGSHDLVCSLEWTIN